MTEHFCDEHETKFFKTANMFGYAHPIKVEDQTVGWCNEDAKEVAKLKPQKTATPPLQVDEPTAKELWGSEMTKGDWAERERIKRQSIERQKALSEAVIWCAAKLQSGEKIKTFNILAIAKLFEEYLDSGVVVEDK